MAQTLTYKGKQITIDGDADPPTVLIDGKAVEVRKIREGIWFTPDIAHRKFSSPLELAKAIADRLG
ncbi:MAG: hypothetical protein WCA00_15970 [Candidatus Acidiferrales bacterium]